MSKEHNLGISERPVCISTKILCFHRPNIVTKIPAQKWKALKETGNLRMIFGNTRKQNCTLNMSILGRISTRARFSSHRDTNWKMSQSCDLSGGALFPEASLFEITSPFCVQSYPTCHGQENRNQGEAVPVTTERQYDICLWVSNALKRYHYHNSYKGNHLIVTVLQLQRIRPLSS